MVPEIGNIWYIGKKIAYYGKLVPIYKAYVISETSIQYLLYKYIIGRYFKTW